MESDYSLKNVYENCQCIPNFKNITESYTCSSQNIIYFTTWCPHRNFMEETTPMNQKKLAQAKQKGKTTKLSVDNKLLQHSHSISTVSVLILKRKLQNTFQRWQSKGITHDKKKSQHQQRRTFMACYNSFLSPPLQLTSQWNHPCAMSYKFSLSPFSCSVYLFPVEDTAVSPFTL